MLVYRNYTEGDIDCYPMYTYHICEGEEKIGKLFLVIKSSYEIRVGIVFPHLLEDWVDLKERHVKEIINLVENHMIIDEPYSKIEYDIDHLNLPL
jgi:uncharacterized protein YfbU (UPF0304 family)